MCMKVLMGLLVLFTHNACVNGVCPEESTLYGENSKEIICYKENKEKHGMHIKWHADGKTKKFRRTYKDNQLDGPYKEWYSNGQLKVRLNYLQNHLNGNYTRWYSNGQIHIKASYMNGTKMGAYLEYYKNGQIKLEYNFNELGKPDGPQTEYRLNGYKSRRRIYASGKLIGKMSWNLSGRLDPIIAF